MVSGYKKPNAAVGQSGLQALYETMFRNYGIMVAQVNTQNFGYMICKIDVNTKTRKIINHFSKQKVQTEMGNHLIDIHGVCICHGCH